MADQPATFLDHKVTLEGLYIRGMSQGQTIYGAVVEIFVPREEVEMFGWIDPLDVFEVKWIHTGKFEAIYHVEARDQEEADTYVAEHRLELEPDEVVALSSDYKQFL